MSVSLKTLIAIATVGAICLVVLVTYPTAAGSGEIILSVPGIPGPYCAYGVEKRLLELDGVERVDLLWKEEKIRAVIAKGKVITSEQIKAAVKRADYPYDYSIIER